jgi:CheY-like chemotaxis protein
LLLLVCLAGFVLHRHSNTKLKQQISNLQQQLSDNSKTIDQLNARQQEVQETHKTEPQDPPDTTTGVLLAEENENPLLLLIDDDRDMLKLLQGVLSPHYRCMLALNGTSGLAKAKEYLPDLVISDVMMPDIDGFEVLCRLKEDALTSHIPVVLLTAKADVQSRIKGWESNADEYIEKPFHVDELLSRVESLLTIRQLLHGRYQHQFGSLEEQIIANDEIDDEQQLLDDDQILNQVNERFIEQLNNAMEIHYRNEAFDVSTLAKELAMSSRQLHRKTKSILDLPPKESIRRFRLKKAAELLKQGVTPGEAAHQVGFASHSYFSQCFKAHFNCPPSAFVD